MKKILIGSGASTKISFMGGVCKAITEKKNDYKIYIGTSASSICLPFIALDRHEFLKKMIIDSKLEDVFDRPLLVKYPFIKKKMPSPWSIFRILIGGNSMSTTTKFRKLLKTHFTEEDFNYLNEFTDKTVYLGVVNYNTNSIMYVNNREYTYDEFISGIIASSNIPIATDPIKIRDSWCVDGGVIDHFANDFAMGLNPDHIDLVISRPKRDLSPNVTGYKSDVTYEEWTPDNIFDVFGRMYNIMMMNVSNDDERLLIENCENDGITLNIYYPPYKLTNEIYSDLNTEINSEWWDLGYKTINK